MSGDYDLLYLGLLVHHKTQSLNSQKVWPAVFHLHWSLLDRDLPQVSQNLKMIILQFLRLYVFSTQKGYYDIFFILQTALPKHIQMETFEILWIIPH